MEKYRARPFSIERTCCRFSPHKKSPASRYTIRPRASSMNLRGTVLAGAFRGLGVRAPAMRATIPVTPGEMLHHKPLAGGRPRPTEDSPSSRTCLYGTLSRGTLAISPLRNPCGLGKKPAPKRENECGDAPAVNSSRRLDRGRNSRDRPCWG